MYIAKLVLALFQKSGRYLSCFGGLLSFALFAAIISGWSNTVSAQISLLKNPNFEQTENGQPEGWNFDKKVRKKGSARVVDSYPGGSGNVLELKPNRKNKGENLLGVGQLLPAESVRGQTLSISTLLGVEGESSAIVGVHVLGKGSGLPFVQLRQDSVGESLVEHNDSISIPEDAEHIVVYAIVEGKSGSAYFDSLRISNALDADKTNSQGESTSNVNVASVATSENALVTVDVNQIIRRVSDDIFGTNVEWIFDAQGLWSVDGERSEPEVVRLSREMGVTLLRFPGGVFSDFYDWRDGIGPLAKRPSTRHFPDGPVSKHYFGTEELLTFANDINANLLLTVNAGTGTPQDAADWVRYMNENKSSEAKVRFWEIGNELYMKGDLSGGHMSAGKYAKAFAKFADEMLAADPDLVLGAIGGLNYGKYQFISDKRWTEKVLKKNADKIGFLSVHNAYAPVLIGSSEKSDPVDIYRAMLSAPIAMEQNFRDLESLLQKYESPEQPINIAVTEWGPFFHVSPESSWVDHVKTLGSALYVANNLNVFLRTPRVTIANYFKLTDKGFMGWIGNRDKEFVATAPYMAFRLYTENIQDDIVATSVASSTYDSKAHGVVAAVKDVPYLDAVASVGDDTVSLFIVNRNLENEVPATIVLNGVIGQQQIVQKTLSGKAIDSNTGTKLPDIPGLKWAKQNVVARFNDGSDEEVTTTQTIVKSSVETTEAGQTLDLLIPPRSVTCLVIEQAQFRSVN